MERFQLDETKAAAWLAAPAGSLPPEQESEIAEDYDPLTGDDDWNTQNMIGAAMFAGVLTGPGVLLYDPLNDGEDPGYSWLVYLDGPTAPKLTSGWNDARHIAGRGQTGAEAALEVLREGVREANHMLSDLEAYVAAQSA